jgi:hypothetical protein
VVVLINWAWAYVTMSRGARLITGDIEHKPRAERHARHIRRGVSARRRARDDRPLLDIAESRSGPTHARVRLASPRGRSPRPRGRVAGGTYDQPFIAEDGTTRALHFCWTYVQSRMRIDEPVALQMAYTRMMMSFLLFHTNPRALLLLGLGGGSLAKYCHRQLPRRASWSSRAIATCWPCDEFAVPPDDERFQRRRGRCGPSSRRRAISSTWS